MAEGSIARIAAMVRSEERFGGELDVREMGDVLELGDDHALVVVVEGTGVVAASRVEPYLERLSSGHAAVLFLRDLGAELAARLPKKLVAQVIPEEPTANQLYFAVDGLRDRLLQVAEDRRLGAALDRSRYEVRQLVEIAKAITQERDIDRLLDLILVKSRFVTGADAGSIYVVEGSERETSGKRLRFKLSQNDSLKFESKEFTIPISTRSIAGYACVTKSAINIASVHDIPEDAPYSYDATFDKRVGYRTRSMITVPMISAEDEVIGVIQLINKKRTPSHVLSSVEDYDREVVPFDPRSAELIHSVASQAGIALENALLYNEIRRIFEGFVRASVQAIEQRDPTTSGHSLRVSVLSCKLAEIVDRVEQGPYATVRFSQRDLKELEYASLLHDFGKIGVREQVLVKAKKLYPHDLEAVRERIHYALKTAEVDALAKKLDLMAKGAGKTDLDRIDEALRARTAELEDAWRTIHEANEPTVLSEGDFTKIHDIAKLTYVDGRGDVRTILLPDEITSLSVRKGSLNDAEMEEIRSHVVHTFEFLSRIPWGKSFSRVAEIAGAHHEKLNGSGYPHGRTSEQIPVQSKIMTIADIYDALTARDRPYKKAMPAERALGILGFEVDGGNVDAELVRLFRDAEVFRAVERELDY